MVAVHSLALAYDNDTNCPSMTLERAAEKLDSLRRAHKLNSVPLARYYLSYCRSLHSMDVFGPTVVSGWRQFVTGDPFIRNKTIVVMGDSGCHVYSTICKKKHRSIVSDLRASAGYPNVNDLTEVGAHPYRQLELLRGWINRHVQFGFAKPGSLGDGTFSGSDFVIIWFDSKNGLQMMANKGTQCLALSLHLVRVCLKSIKC